eukprot:TRINITY_DN16271_c0_g1_i2.p1 TRINITY_DN16271_c0_g1~~TRINITY_DN16271_c0_g1_i2.p1  ORF type:complete len:408 (+),score=80.72 TRINITY_DN16271_c0_g1_i2:75-1298(+)
MALPLAIAAFVSFFLCLAAGDNVALDTCEAVRGTALLQRGASTLTKAPAQGQQDEAVAQRTPRGSASHARTLERHSPDKPTFAVFTRVIAQELPYVLSFVEHYQRLGVSHFYMLSNKEEDLPKVERYLRRWPVQGVEYTFVFREGGADDILTSPGLLEHISEDYVVGVDCDEFWSLPHGLETFHDLVAHDHSDAFHAHWAISANEHMRFDEQPPYHTYRMPNTKWIAKRRALHSVGGIHEAALKRGPGHHYRINWDAGKVVHFWARSFKDVAGKGLAQFFRDGTHFKTSSDKSGPYHGCEGLNRTLELLDRGDLPERFKVMALMVLHPKPQRVHSSTPMLRIDTDMEDEQFAALVDGDQRSAETLLQKLERRYQEFKSCLQLTLEKHPEKARMNPKHAADWLEDLDC